MNLTIKPFSESFLKSEGAKAMALKPLEEAAEIYGAWQQNLVVSDPSRPSYDLVYETVDCIQACVNLLEFMGVSEEAVEAMYRTVESRNKQRGRY